MIDKTKALRDALRLPGAHSILIQVTFECMETAEREIRRARLTKAQGARVFRAVLPSSFLLDKSQDLYAAHVRELCARVKSGAKLAPGTDAECLAAILDTSLIAPLERNACAAADVLFVSVFPDKELPDHAPGESWAGAAADVISALRKKCTNPRRDAPEES